MNKLKITQIESNKIIKQAKKLRIILTKGVKTKMTKTVIKIFMY